MATTSTPPVPGHETAPGTFRVLGKHILRASIVALQMGTRADGSPNIVQQPGSMERLEVGTELTDVTEAELKAFGDRLEPVDEAAKKSLAKAKGLPEDAEPDTVLPPAGAPSSPADTSKPLDVVQEAPELVSAKAEASRRQGTASPPSAAAPVHETPSPVSPPSEAEHRRRSGG